MRKIINKYVDGMLNGIKAERGNFSPIIAEGVGLLDRKLLRVLFFSLFVFLFVTACDRSPDEVKQLHRVEEQKQAEIKREVDRIFENIEDPKLRPEDYVQPPEVIEGNYPQKWINYAPRQHSEIYWIDNRYVLFSGVNTGKWDALMKSFNRPKHKAYTEEQNKQLRALEKVFIWDTLANTVTPKYEGGRACYSKGYLVFHKEYKEEKRRRFEVFGGTLNDVQLMEDVIVNPKREVRYLSPELQKGEGYIPNPFTCLGFNLKDNNASLDRVIKPLHSEHGWLDYGLTDTEKNHASIMRHVNQIKNNITQDNSKLSNEYSREYFFRQQVKLHKPDGTVIPLIKPDGSPITGLDVGRIRNVSYSQYHNKYLIYGAVGHYWDYSESTLGMTTGMKGRPSPEPYPYYVLSPDTGAVEQKFIPAGPWMPPDDLVLTKKGALRYNRLFTDDGRVMAVYTQTKRGGVIRPAVSPDGCKVAQPGGGGTIVMINLCNTENNDD